MSLKNLLERLAAFEPTQYPFISLYLNAQANDRGRDNGRRPPGPLCFRHFFAEGD